MKKFVLLCLAAIAANGLFAAENTPAETKKITPPPKEERAIRDSLPVCSEAKVTFDTMVHKLPPNLSGTVVKVESPRVTCQAQYLSVVSVEGGFYLGIPWFLDSETAGTLEEKLKHFTWTNMQQSFDPMVDRVKTRDGLFKVTLVQTTEQGKLPLEGEIDPAGTVFFFGHFRPLAEDARSARLKVFEPFIAGSPTTGAAKPAVTVVEFSDFECPSCQHASSFLKPILDKYGDKVRYVRYDLPLVGTHPWAFAAAVAGRAIYNQKPEIFWEYKKQIYANQDKLNAFLIDDFARNFAKDHDLDLAKYDADVASPAIREHLIKGVGTAFSNDIRATPSYLVNGTLVDPGSDGKALEDYVAAQLK
jgi:hypothetical protein